MYPVFYVGFYCMGYVREREYVKTQAPIEDKVDFARRFARRYPTK